MIFESQNTSKISILERSADGIRKIFLGFETLEKRLYEASVFFSR
jgi:hypothetical protein